MSWNGMSQAAIGRALGLTRERVRQIIRDHDRDRRGETGNRLVRLFWMQVAKQPDGCWIWTGHRNNKGYGISSVRIARDRLAHRTAYVLVRGQIPDGLELDHLCRVPACVNPDHLEPVTRRENLMRSPITIAHLNASKTHCKQGHPFNEENTLRDADGARRCKACAREYQRLYYLQHKGGAR